MGPSRCHRARLLSRPTGRNSRVSLATTFAHIIPSTDCRQVRAGSARTTQRIDSGRSGIDASTLKCLTRASSAIWLRSGSPLAETDVSVITPRVILNFPPIRSIRPLGIVPASAVPCAHVHPTGAGLPRGIYSGDHENHHAAHSTDREGCWHRPPFEPFSATVPPRAIQSRDNSAPPLNFR